MAFNNLVDGGGVLTQPFGCTNSGLEWTCPGRGCPYRAGFHAGIDIAASPAGRTVRALGSGQVVQIGENCGCCAVSGGCGSRCGLGPNAVIIRSGPVLIKYGHLLRALVAVGQWVSPGTPVGLMGSCGCSTGPHLHYEVQPLAPLGNCVGNGCQALDPLPYLSSWPGSPPGPAPPPAPIPSASPLAPFLLLLGGASLLAFWGLNRTSRPTPLALESPTLPP